MPPILHCFGSQRTHTQYCTPDNFNTTYIYKSYFDEENNEVVSYGINGTLTGNVEECVSNVKTGYTLCSFNDGSTPLVYCCTNK